VIEGVQASIMNRSEFSNIRHYLGKSQVELSRSLCISPVAVKSIEKGVRKIPALIERQMLFLLFNKVSPVKMRPCWQIKKCRTEVKNQCPAWELRAGHICWFITGTVCGGEAQESWDEKIAICRDCEVFNMLFDHAMKDLKGSIINLDTCTVSDNISIDAT
jgi:DNA-binding XRE family transcriptional regulator